MEKHAIRIAVGIGVVALIAFLTEKATQPQAQPAQRPTRQWSPQKAKGDIWQTPVTLAPSASSANSYPRATVL